MLTKAGLTNWLSTLWEHMLSLRDYMPEAALLTTGVFIRKLIIFLWSLYSNCSLLSRGKKGGTGLESRKKTKRGFHSVLVNVDMYSTEHS